MLFPSFQWDRLLGELSRYSAAAIVVALVIHLCVFALLWWWARRDQRAIATCLFDFTRRLKHQSLLDPRAHLSDQIDAFLADVNEVLDDPSKAEDRQSLSQRMNLLDEQRRYLYSLSFETVYNITRTMIEAYPLMGITGTIMAIGAALASDAAGTEALTVASIVSRFGEAIWSTFAGLVSAVALMFINSLFETGFERLAENRRDVRATIARAKRELSMNSTSRMTAAPTARDSQTAPAAGEPR